jgi:hypothetical protein
MLIIIFAIAGLVGIVAGIYSLRWLSRFSSSGRLPIHWKSLRIGILVSGILLGLASWPLTYAMGYPYEEPGHGTGRIVGLPFFVAYFDSEGFDFVGPITPVSAFANVAFWFLLPHVLLAVFAKLWQAHIGTKTKWA